MNMAKKKRIEREFNRWIGWVSGIMVMMLALVVWLTFKGLATVIVGVLVLSMVLMLMNPANLGGFEMLQWMKKMIGISAVEGKLGALAEHLGLKFSLIPEHWKCEKAD